MAYSMDIGQALERARSNVEKAKLELDEARRVLERARAVENHYRRLLKGGKPENVAPAQTEDAPESP